VSTAPAPTVKTEPKPTPAWFRPALVGGLVGALFAGVFSLALSAQIGLSGFTASQVPVPRDPAAAQVAPAVVRSDIGSVLRSVSPSVVTVHVSSDEGTGAGTGVVYSASGLIITNAHVVAGAQRIEVDLASGETIEAKLVKAVPSADVAVLQLEGEFPTLQPAVLGSSATTEVGTAVVAIGNALDLGGEPSVTTGVISANGRSLTGPDGATLTSLLQTDAAINPGNSGGPLVNLAGQVIGINTAILADAQNVGFALAIDQVRSVVEQVLAGDDTVVHKPVIGVSVRDVAAIDPDVLAKNGTAATQGAYVESLSDAGPAATAGVEVSDVIVTIDRSAVRSPADVARLVAKHLPGDVITVTVDRAGTEMELRVTVGKS
jgi:S1-C subfamily serine protease